MRKFLQIFVIILSFILLASGNYSSYASNQPTLEAGEAWGRLGDTVEIPVSISNNSGIIALYCQLDYDASSLELTGLTNGDVLADPAHSGSLTTLPYRLSFDMSLASSNNTNNGVIVTLEFKILPSAKLGDSPISISYNPDEIYDYWLNNVAFDVLDGQVHIVSEESYATVPEPLSTESSSQPADPSAPDQDLTTTPSTSLDSIIKYTSLPSNEMNWEIVIVEGNRIEDKNITIEHLEEGFLVRGDDLKDVVITVEKESGEQFSAKVDAHEDEILFIESDDGQIQGFIDNDANGIFDHLLLELQPLKKAGRSWWLPLTLVLLLVVGAFLVIKRRYF